MFLNFIQLQAAIGLGILLMTIMVILLFGVFPALIISLSIKEIKRRKKNDPNPISKKEYVIIILKQTLLSVLLILALLTILILFIYFFVDLSIS